MKDEKDKSVMPIDPVCGMTVDPNHAAGTYEYKNKTYYFCSTHCLKKFSENPEEYLKASVTHVSSEQMAGEEGTKYVCPMCPEVRENKPGPCPNCGMALEPESIDEEDDDGDVTYICPMHPEVEKKEPGECPICGMDLEPDISVSKSRENRDQELVDMAKRFWISLIFTIPIFIIAMNEMLLGIDLLERLTYGTQALIQACLASPVVLWAGLPFFRKANNSIINKKLNMFTLIALGTGVAYLYSLVAIIAPGIFPESMRNMHGNVAVYFEASAVIITLVLMGQVLELKARAQTSQAIKMLLGLKPKIAHIVREDGSEEDIKLSKVKVGDNLRIKPGEKIPVDGVVTNGSSAVDESMITGESIPVIKEAGKKVIAGSVNQTGSFLMNARQVGKDTMLAQIIRMVGTAQRSRAPIHRLADQVSAYFVPAVIGVSIITFVVWLIWGPDPKLAFAIVNAVAVLIVACPCALGLATPMSIMVGTGRGARSGILFKNAEALETLEKVDTLIIDKTGTLTEGKPVVTTIITFNDWDKNMLLRLTASLERASEHPLANSIVEIAKKNGLELADAKDFNSLTGKGVEGDVDGKKILVGSSSFLDEMGIDTDIMLREANTLRESGSTVVFSAVDGRAAGIFGIEDPIKESTRSAIDQLKKRNIKIIMVTGDNRKTAEAVARKLDLKEIETDVLPEGKNSIVEAKIKEGRIVAMAGDGINDAPALARAHVGIAMGTGTDVAIDSAGITLIKGDLMGIVHAIRLSKATMTNIRENLFFAFIYNSLGVPIAAGVLYPFFGILLSPMIAAAAMSFSSVSVIVNSLRLSRMKI